MTDLTRELEVLGPDDVHVFFFHTSQIAGDPLVRACEALLTDEEKARRARYIFDKNKLEYLATRTLARTTLSRYARVAPEAWRFTPNQYGRPEISGPDGAPRLRFNLSNTVKLVACAVSLDRDVGIDVEDSTRSGETVAIADRFFSDQETKELRALPASRQHRRFFEYWTLKEAYIKARGMGLALPLDGFSFLLGREDRDPRDGRGPRVGIAIDPKLEDDAATWEFEQFSPDADHFAAVAVRKRGGAGARVTIRRVDLSVDRGAVSASASAWASASAPGGSPGAG